MRWASRLKVPRSVLTALALVSVAYWVALAIVIELTVRGVPPPPAATERGTAWPKVSLVVPGRDEEEHLARALRSKLADDYPNLEVVFVNDRSTDDTGGLAEALAREDARLTVVHVASLPEGWLGKVHAMQRGLEASTGAWVLFTDADVELARGTLRRVIDYAEQQRFDHVSLLPRVTGTGALLEAAMNAFFRVIVLGGRLWQVARAESSAAAGIGAFNLVRRDALAKTPGLEWLKLEIGDDMALGVMMKREGHRSCVLAGRDLLSLDFYPSYGAMVRAVEKNGAAAPFPILVLVNLAVVMLEAGFLLGPFELRLPAYVLSTLVSLRVSGWLGLPRWPAFVPGAGMALLSFAMVRSAVLCLARGGVLWRGTLYPTAAVRAGNRLGITPSARRR